METNDLWLLLKMLPTNYSFTNPIYLIYMYKEDLTLNNLQRLICHKTTNQPTAVFIPNDLVEKKRMDECLLL